MNLDFRGVNRVLVSEAGAEVTEIYCSSSGGGIYFHSGETEASVVSGFTISWANAYGPGAQAALVRGLLDARAVPAGLLLGTIVSGGEHVEDDEVEADEPVEALSEE